jgi:hypothetical protein
LDLGYTVDTANDGLAALELSQLNLYRLVGLRANQIHNSVGPTALNPRVEGKDSKGLGAGPLEPLGLTPDLPPRLVAKGFGAGPLEPLGLTPVLTR